MKAWIIATFITRHLGCGMIPQNPVENCKLQMIKNSIVKDNPVLNTYIIDDKYNQPCYNAEKLLEYQNFLVLINYHYKE